MNPKFQFLYVRWAESEIAVGNVLADGGDNHQCDNGANKNPKIRMREYFFSHSTSFSIR